MVNSCRRGRYFGYPKIQMTVYLHDLCIGNILRRSFTASCALAVVCCVMCILLCVSMCCQRQRGWVAVHEWRTPARLDTAVLSDTDRAVGCLRSWCLPSDSAPAENKSKHLVGQVYMILHDMLPITETFNLVRRKEKSYTPCNCMRWRFTVLLVHVTSCSKRIDTIYFQPHQFGPYAEYSFVSRDFVSFPTFHSVPIISSILYQLI